MDHKPSNPLEKNRIAWLGGEAFMFLSVWTRGLAASRATPVARHQLQTEQGMDIGSDTAVSLIFLGCQYHKSPTTLGLY